MFRPGEIEDYRIEDYCIGKVDADLICEAMNSMSAADMENLHDAYHNGCDADLGLAFRTIVNAYAFKCFESEAVEVLQEADYQDYLDMRCN